MFDRLDDILIRFEELLHELGDPVLASDPQKFRRLMKEQAELAPLVETYTQYKKTKKSIEENLELLIQRMEETGMNTENYDFYLDLRKYGSTRHAGFGLGFERCVMYLTGISNIRDVIPFPRTTGNCEY